MIELSNLTVLRGLLNDELIAALARRDNGEREAAEFLNAVFRRGCETCLRTHIEELILTDENPFSVRCATKKAISERLELAFQQDLTILRGAAQSACRKFDFEEGSSRPPFEQDAARTCEGLRAYYQKFGYGPFLRNAAFTFGADGLRPMRYLSRVTLAELKDYREEKSEIERNITGFLQGLPFLNMLLYGDKGTGKSSTVHAMLDRYFDDGLRLIELDDQSLTRIGEIRQSVAQVPLKFLLFLDDIALDGNDERLSAVKASLEGTLSGGADNTMIVATSNRRHIVKENFSDRADAVHASDAMDEQLSLSDRFGLTVLFSTTDKARYLSIVRQLAADKRLCIGDDELCTLAERWALTKGGRSPRRAKQFVDLLYSCLSRGLNPDF